MVDTVESIKTARDPQAAFEVMKAAAEAGMAMFAKNLKEVTSLRVDQFLGNMDALEKGTAVAGDASTAAKAKKAR